MGDTCTLVADLCQCMANRPQYCKVNSLQLNKLIKKKKKKQQQESPGEALRVSSHRDGSDSTTGKFCILVHLNS